VVRFLRKLGGYCRPPHGFFAILGYCSASNMACADVVPVVVTTNINTPIEIDLSFSITNIATPNISIASPPTYGTATIHPDSPLTIIYTPNLNYEGLDNFVYRAINDSGTPEEETVSVLVGENLTGFRITDLTPNSSLYSNMHLADLDGDSDLDLMGETGEPFHVFWNTGNGEFTDSPFQPFYGSAYGDIDNDGDIDSVALSLATIINDGNGVFDVPPPQPVERAPIPSDGGTQKETPKTMALGDLDNDGDLDAFIITDQTNHIALNNGQGEFTETPTPIGNADSTAVKLADLDCDADLDAFVANKGINSVWMNDGSGNFTASNQPFTNSYSTGVELGDMDNDGDVDALVINAYPNQYQIWLNDGNGGFYVNGEPTNTTDYMGSAVLGDIDDDGDLDMFFDFLPDANAVPYSRLVIIYLNSGAGHFAIFDGHDIFNAFSFFEGHRFTTMGDIDGDRDLDFVLGSTPNKVLFNELKQTQYSLLQFKHKSFQTSENSSLATITLSRSGGHAGALSVHFTTMDDTATSGEDYLPVSGELHWEDGDMSDKQFSIEILSDNVMEGNESIAILLRDLMGGAVLDTESTELVISESELISPKGQCNTPRNIGNDTPNASDGGGGGGVNIVFVLVSALVMLFLMWYQTILRRAKC
jgi:hypothetical protein